MFSEADARKILAGERAQVIVELVDSAWSAHVAEQRARSRRTRANVVWDYMIDFADRELVTLDGVSRYEEHGIPMYVFDDRLVLRFKKHEPNLFITHNVLTDHQHQIHVQGHLEGLPRLVHVTAGYVLDAAEAAISQIVVARRLAGNLDWYIDLRELASGVLAPVTPALPLDYTDPAPLPTIASRGHEKEDEER